MLQTGLGAVKQELGSASIDVSEGRVNVLVQEHEHPFVKRLVVSTITFPGHGDTTYRYIIAMNPSGAMANDEVAWCLGGMRIRQYESVDEQIEETISLAGKSGETTGMAAKYRCIGLINPDLCLGGGKSTICPIGFDLEKMRTDAEHRSELFEAVGYAIQLANRHQPIRYITAEDSGTSDHDMIQVRQGLRTAANRWLEDKDEACKAVSLLPAAYGGYGDPSPHTAKGVHRSMMAAAKWLDIDVTGNAGVLIYGCGACGQNVAKEAVSAGIANLWLAEGNPDTSMAMSNISATVLGLGNIPASNRNPGYTRDRFPTPRVVQPFGTFPRLSRCTYGDEIKVLVPCGMGRTCSCENLEILKHTNVKLVCGSENIIWTNYQTGPKDYQDSGITVVPAELSNMMGAYLASLELHGRDPSETESASIKLGELTVSLLDESRRRKLPPQTVLTDWIGPNS